MAEIAEFAEKLQSSWCAESWQDVTVMVAISGGADSVALLRGLLSARRNGIGKVMAAHFNHGLRGKESDDDQRFVAALCNVMKVTCEFGQASNDLVQNSSATGIEARARQARYDFFENAATKNGARYVATAHTADDQAETILHRILRGTGIAGLSGIPKTRSLNSSVTIVRPMLAIRRRVVIAYLESLGQSFRVDQTNEDVKFTRNRIRQELLPQLAGEYNPNVIDALLRLGQLAGETQSIVDSLVIPLFDSAVSTTNGEAVAIDGAQLRDEPHFLHRELLKSVWRKQSWPEQPMTFEHWGKLSDLISRDSATDEPKTSLPGNVFAEKKGGQLILTRPS